MRMKANAGIKGFSLVELIVVIGIISIILSIVSINFSSWQKKYSIENQAKEMMADLSDLRMRAIQTKSNHVAVLSASPTMMTFKSYSSEEPVTLANGKPMFSKTLKYSISNNATSLVPCVDINFTTRGYTQSVPAGGMFSNQTIYILPTGTGAAIDCLVISNTRINLGKYNGTDCSFR